jgi:hypothetical protein
VSQADRTVGITKMLLMLEDDRDRIERFACVLGSVAIQLTYFRTAHDFIRAYESLTIVPKLISLDHDLFVDHDNDPDPGDGRDVAKFLALHKPISPILIHSTNAIAADSMLFTLQDAGWTVDRIAPIGDDWIESYWFPTAMNMIQSQS